MEKEKTLAEIKKELEENKSVPLRESNLVFGEGSPDAAIMFIGEAPGFYEDRERRPFVGRAGKLLDRLIGDIGMRREDVYITNIVKRRPPENRDPLPEELSAYRPYLAREIDAVDPKIIATLGRFSMNYFLPDGKISRDQGKVFWWGEKILLPLYHPAAALRSTSVLGDLEKSFKTLKAVVIKYDELVRQRRGKSSAEVSGDKEEQTSLF
ncbi:uracil-DNA glycosylase [Patescibacteria group bacterium]|jgi:DNA polymerase|nr:uracil-DNA glycosylase [Patescibacteria group bacterium]MCL5114447.1 uracil-DNA glycosylase [Patescibacteria group bacterium]